MNVSDNEEVLDKFVNEIIRDFEQRLSVFSRISATYVACIEFEPPRKVSVVSEGLEAVENHCVKACLAIRGTGIAIKLVLANEETDYYKFPFMFVRVRDVARFAMFIAMNRELVKMLARKMESKINAKRNVIRRALEIIKIVELVTRDAE